MGSIIEGYSYDIFISYRQKDNKHDGWVTEFVENLKGELESTFKEEISVYFDINPHDGLLETHDVSESLKDKLKCLIFIPIISRTYCDPRSFAWEHELKAFLEFASKDQFGLKVKLPNGNVAGRVLPVRIYDLDSNDIKLCEAELGGVLRGIEFIYRSAGVNRPLRSKEDNPNDNLNRTFYRDQINKAANSIKEIFQGLKPEQIHPAEEKAHPREFSAEALEIGKKSFKEKHVNEKKRKYMLPAATLVLLLIIAGIIFVPVIFKRKALGILRSSDKGISLVVMPFQNLTNDTTWNVWQDGIQANLTTILSNSENNEIKVRQTENINSLLQGKSSVNYASISPSVASSISQKLEADIVVNGSINKAGNILRLNAQLINSRTEEVLKSFQVDGTAGEESIFRIIDTLSLMVRNYLIISELKKELPLYTFYGSSLTNSPEALRYFIYGKNDFDKLKYASARNWFSQAISLDSNFVLAMLQLSMAYGNQNIYPEAKKWCLKAFQKRSLMSPQMLARANYIYARFFETAQERIIYLRKQLDYDDQNPAIYFNLGSCYDDLFEFEKSIPEYEKALKISDKWGVKPFWVLNYIYLGGAYHKTGQYRKERKLYEKAEIDFPAPNERLGILRRKLILAIAEKDTSYFRKTLKQAEFILNNIKYSEANRTSEIALMFEEGNDINNAETYYRKAFSLQPDNGLRINNLAYFLINKDRNIPEGLELINRLVMTNPDNYEYLHTQGWGLYKLQKYQEAREILQESWDLRMKNAIYDHQAYLHLEAAINAATVKKAD